MASTTPELRLLVQGMAVDRPEAEAVDIQIALWSAANEGSPLWARTLRVPYTALTAGGISYRDTLESANAEAFRADSPCLQPTPPPSFGLRRLRLGEVET
mgnify:CR=1 FL=1